MPPVANAAAVLRHNLTYADEMIPAMLGVHPRPELVEFRLSCNFDNKNSKLLCLVSGPEI